jgi:hypothetical protein
MRWKQTWDWIATQDAESDEGFREEIARLSQRSLYIIGAVEFGMPLISLFFGLLLDPAIRERFHFQDMFAYFVMGGIAIGAGRIESLRRHFRLIAYAIGTATAALMVWQHLQRSRGTGAGRDGLVRGAGGSELSPHSRRLRRLSGGGARSVAPFDGGDGRINGPFRGGPEP